MTREQNVKSRNERSDIEDRGRFCVFDTWGRAIFVTKTRKKMTNLARPHCHHNMVIGAIMMLTDFISAKVALDTSSAKIGKIAGETADFLLSYVLTKLYENTIEDDVEKLAYDIVCWFCELFE